MSRFVESKTENPDAFRLPYQKPLVELLSKLNRTGITNIRGAWQNAEDQAAKYAGL